MADADKTLKLLIELGFIGQDKAAAAEAALKAQKKSVQELADEEVARSKEVIAQKQQEMRVLEQLQQQRETFSKAGRDTGELDHAIKRLNQSLNGSSHHFNSSRLNAELFRLSMMSLGAYMPGLETAMYAVFSSGQVAFLGIMGALLGLENEMKSITETASIQEAVFKGDADAIKAVQSATERADIAARLFLDDLIRQNAAGESAADIAGRLADNYKNLVNAQGELDKAQKSVGEASIADREKKGLITHQQALEEKYQLDVYYAKRKLQLDAWLHQQEENAKRGELATQEQQLKSLFGDQKTDEASARKAEQEKARHDARMQTAKDNRDAAQKTLDELAKSHGSIVKGQINDDNVQKMTEYYEKCIGSSKGVNLSDQFLKLQQAMKSITNPASWDFGLTKLLDRDMGGQSVDALAKYQGAKEQIERAKSELAKLEKTQFDVDLNAQRTAKQLSTTDDAIKTIQTSINKLSNEFPKLTADNRAKEANDTAIANLNLQAEAVKNGLQPPVNPLTPPPRATPTGSWPIRGVAPSAPPPTPEDQLPWPQRPEAKARGDFNQFETAFGILSKGGKLDAQQTQYMQHIAELMTGQHIKGDKMLEFMRSILLTQKSRDAAFERELETLRSQIGNSRRAYGTG